MGSFQSKAGRVASVVAAAGAALLAALVAGTAAASGSSLVREIALRPAQVGPHYRLLAIPGGDKVAGQVTLDLCGSSYASERLRIARHQVAYLAAGLPPLSNEVVQYRHGGAAAALNELRGVEKNGCARPTTWHIVPLNVPHLLPASVAVSVTVSATQNGKPQKIVGIAVYQFKGDVLSAVYTLGGGSLASQERVAFRAAAGAAGNLARLAP